MILRDRSVRILILVLPRLYRLNPATSLMLSMTVKDSKAIGKKGQCLDHTVEPLKIADTSRAAASTFDAFVEDPLNKYLLADASLSPTLLKAVNKLCFLQWRRTKVVLTVDAGAAVVVATPPEEPQAPIDHLIGLLLSWFLSVLRHMGSREGRKRTKEATKKIQQVVSETLGNRIDQMFCVNLLATEPLSQGRGYGGALLDAVIGLADDAGQAVWLTSSNINNTEFYMSHGFRTVGVACLGDDNPDWHDKPVLVPIMVREPIKRY